MTRARRLRGVLLRFVLNRPVAITVGLVLLVPAVWLLWTDHPWESGATDGLALVALGTGVALTWTGITGRQPDWVDPEG